MSDLHCRGCDCDDCCPGFPATATPVHHDTRRIGPLALSAEQRAYNREKQLKWQQQQRSAYLAAKRAWYHRWRKTNPSLTSRGAL